MFDGIEKGGNKIENGRLENGELTVRTLQRVAKIIYKSKNNSAEEDGVKN